MRVPDRPLTFSAVDDLGFAAAGGSLQWTQLPSRYFVSAPGPLLELLSLVASGHLPAPSDENWLVPNAAAPMITALLENREHWVSRDNQRMGFIRAARSGPDGDSLLTAFLMDAQRAARDVARLPGTTPGQLAAAMEELENNIHEHSEAAGTGMLAFHADPGAFEFVAVDRGIGILDSLRKSPAFASLSDQGKALEMALTDGISRFGTDSERGHGFRPIFVGLLNLHGALRFRSGDHALLMDGTTPNLATAQLAQKPPMDGFFASIRCQVG